MISYDLMREFVLCMNDHQLGKMEVMIRNQQQVRKERRDHLLATYKPSDEVMKNIKEGLSITAIKLIRQEFKGVSLVEAKMLHDGLRDRMKVTSK